MIERLSPKSRSSGHPVVDFEAYRKALSMSEVLERLRITVNGNGIISCPAHSEDHPSCRIFEHHCHCFGCGFHEDTIGIVMRIRACGFWESLEWIADQAGLQRPERSAEAQARYQQALDRSVILETTFQDGQKHEDEAIKYLLHRKITPDIARGRVSYFPLDYEPANKGDAAKAGLLYESGRFVFAGHVVFPYRQAGRIQTLYGRFAGDTEPQFKHRKPLGPQPPALFNLESINPSQPIYVSESPIKALALMSKGHDNAVALAGLTFSDAHAELLRRAKAETAILCFDTDSNGRGQEGALKAAEKLFSIGIEAQIVTLPLPDSASKIDLDEYFLYHSAEDFDEIRPRNFLDCLMDCVPRDGTPRQRYKALAPILELVSVQPELLWKEYVRAVNERFPEYDKRKLEKEISEHRKAGEDTQERSKRFLPLEYVDKIRSEAPVISFDGKVYRYEHGVYSLQYLEEIDQKTIHLIGQETQTSHLHAVRTFLGSVCFVRPETINPRGLLNLRNGILNLESGQFDPHSPEILSTVQAETAFDPKATCPLWLQTIKEILPDPASQHLLAQIFGYCLIPDNSFQKGFIFFGEGANGKSVITDVLATLVGKDNSSALHLNDFKERFRLAELQNRLVNFSTEVAAKGLVDDAKLKGVITGDPITAERKNQDPFVFRPFVKLIVSCNNLPRSTDKSHGFFRRWTILPFSVTFPPEKWDRTRAKRIIETELSGCLNWAIGGYKSLKDRGHFIEPATSTEALQEYKRQTNPVIDFVEEHVRVFKDNAQCVLLKDLFPAYNDWTKANGYGQMGRNNFTRAFERATGKLIHKFEAGKGFAGIALI